MLEMSKIVLQQVSFDRKLFRKELIKMLKWLKPSERTLLYSWCLTRFEKYRDMILEVFRQIVRRTKKEKDYSLQIL